MERTGGCGYDVVIRLGWGDITPKHACNVHQINTNRATLFALPLKLAGCEGAPARVTALLD